MIVPDHPAPAVVAGNALEMKICVRTYRTFYVSNTADFFYKPSPTSLAGTPWRFKGAWFTKLKGEPKRMGPATSSPDADDLSEFLRAEAIRRELDWRRRIFRG